MPARAASPTGWASSGPFASRIEVGDLVVLPFKTQSAIAMGTIAGPYAYRADLPAETHHTRATKWLKTDIPRARFDQDLLYMFGAFMTVCQLQRHQAEERIRAMSAGRRHRLANDESRRGRHAGRPRAVRRGRPQRVHHAQLQGARAGSPGR